MKLKSKTLYTLVFWVALIILGMGESFGQNPGPPCTNDAEPPGETACEATSICSFNGYCGRADATYSADSWFELTNEINLYLSPIPGLPMGGVSIENDSYLKFVASASTISFNVYVYDCIAGTGGSNATDAIQIVFFSAANCGSGPVTIYYADKSIPQQTAPHDITVTGLTPGDTYYILIDGAAGRDCGYTFEAVEGIASAVTIDVAPEVTICQGESVTATATGGESGVYNWSGDTGLSATTGDVVTITPPATPGTYHYEVESTGGTSDCPNSDSDELAIIVDNCQDPCEDVTITYSESSTDASCGSADGTINLTATGGTAPYLYSIDGGATTQSSNEFTGLAAGSYNIVIYDDNGCETTGSISLINQGGPTVSAPTDLTICLGEGVELTANNPDGATISWDNGVTDGDEVFPTTTTTYTVTATMAGCDATDQVTVTVDDVASPSFSADITSGCADLTVTFTENSGINNGTCAWDFGDGTTSSTCGTVSHTYTQAGDYDVTLTVTSSAGCEGTSTETAYIHVISGPTASFSANPTTSVIPNTMVEFTNESTGADDYIWNFGDDSPLENGEDAIHVFPMDNAGIYNVTLYASNQDCTDSTTLQITIKLPGVEFELPNVFTPNGDGDNDLFKFIYQKNIKEFLSVIVLNRWGNKVYESDQINFAWNGKVNNTGGACSEGTYFFVVKVKDFDDQEHEKNGFVHLLTGKK